MLKFEFIDTTDNSNHEVNYEDLPPGGLPVYFKNIGRNWDDMINPKAIAEQQKLSFVKYLQDISC